MHNIIPYPLYVFVTSSTGGVTLVEHRHSFNVVLLYQSFSTYVEYH